MSGKVKPKPRKRTTSRTRRTKRLPSTETALTYAKATAGAKYAPKYVRQQCERFVEGVEKRQWPYDEKAVEEAVWFFHGLPVPMGEYGNDGRIKLAPPQVFWTAELYGRRHPDNEARRWFSEFYLVVPRKAGKSTYGAAMCLRELCDPTRNGPIAQTAGRTEDHGRHVYDRAQRMVNNSESLRKRYSLVASDRQIRRTDGSNAKMVCETGNIKDGAIPVIATFDELHDTEDMKPIEVLRSSFGASRDPMLAKFTTAGYLPMSLGLQEREVAIQDFKGTASTPRFLTLLYEWDDELGEHLDDGDPRLWEAIHPMFKHTVEPDYYQSYWERAQVNSKAMAEFNHKLLCKWMRGDQSLVITEDMWDSLPESPPLEKVSLRRAWIGNDSAEVDDLTSLTLLGELEDGRLCAWWKVLCPASKLGAAEAAAGNGQAKLTDSAYVAWHRDGWIETCGDYRTDFADVAKRMSKWMREHHVRLALSDQFSGNDLIDAALPPAHERMHFGLRKLARHTTPAVKELIAMVEDKRLAIDKSPLVKWAVCNAVMDRRVDGSMLPKKPTPDSPQKIDPLDSLVWAIRARQLDISGNMPGSDKHRPIEIRNMGYGGKIVRL